MILIGVLAGTAPAQEEGEVLSPVLRHTHYFVLVDPGEAPRVSLETRAFYHYADGVTVAITDPEGDLRFEGMAPLGQSLEATMEGEPAHAFMVTAEPGMNGIVFHANTPWCVFVGGRWGLGSNNDVPPMYLWVPPDCEQFTVAGLGESPGESGRIMIDDPSGEQVAVMDDTFDERQETLIEVSEEHRGAVWTLRWSDPREAEGGLDDINTFVEGALTPVLWPSPEWAEEYGQTLWERHRAAMEEQPATAD
jgi:hypothetical protein